MIDKYENEILHKMYTEAMEENANLKEQLRAIDKINTSYTFIVCHSKELNDIRVVSDNVLVATKHIMNCDMPVLEVWHDGRRIDGAEDIDKEILYEVLRKYKPYRLKGEN